jgi:hypothetical protein
MQQISSKCVAAALALAVIIAASSAAQAHHDARQWRAAWQRPDILPYDYSYFPVMGYSLYGNCYLVEQFAPYRPYLVRVFVRPADISARSRVSAHPIARAPARRDGRKTEAGPSLDLEYFSL